MNSSISILVLLTAVAMAPAACDSSAAGGAGGDGPDAGSDTDRGDDPDPDTFPDPDDRDRESEVRVLALDVTGAPSAGAHVIAHRASGTVYDHTTTDEMGLAVFDATHVTAVTIAGSIPDGLYRILTLGSVEGGDLIRVPDPAAGKYLRITLPSYTGVSAGDSITYLVDAGCGQKARFDHAGAQDLYLWRYDCATGGVIQLFAEVRVNDKTTAYHFEQNLPVGSDDIAFDQWLSGDSNFASRDVDVSGLETLPNGWTNYSAIGHVLVDGTLFRPWAGQMRGPNADTMPTISVPTGFGTPAIHSRFIYHNAKGDILARGSTRRSLDPGEVESGAALPLSYETLPMPVPHRAGTIDVSLNPARPHLTWDTEDIAKSSAVRSIIVRWNSVSDTPHRWEIMDRPAVQDGDYVMPVLPDQLAFHWPTDDIKDALVRYTRAIRDGQHQPVFSPEDWMESDENSFLSSSREVFLY